MEQRKMIGYLLREIGVPMNIIGYRYLKEAIAMTVQNPEVSIKSGYLYSKLATKFYTTSSCVEKSISLAIEIAFTRGDLEVLESFFGNTVNEREGKPTNYQFISTVAEKVRNGLVLNQKMSEEVTYHLANIGVPTNIKGYYNLKEAIILALDNPNLIHNMMRGIYAQVAENLGSTSANVEHTMRTAVSIAFKRGDKDILRTYFGNTVNYNMGKISNSKFIAAIVEKILDNCK